MMDESLVFRINNLITKYKSSKSRFILDEIEYNLNLLNYQAWDVKYDLRLIEHPNKYDKHPDIKKYINKYDHPNAFSKYHLIIPLLLYLFQNHNQLLPALETSLNFMSASRNNLRPGDFAKTKTGVQRFVTNTRFASLELRNYGLLRSDKKRFYKYWQLSLFGILVAGKIYMDFENELASKAIEEIEGQSVKIYSSKILYEYTKKICDTNNVREILIRLLEDEVVANHYDLFNSKFIDFAKYILEMLTHGYNTRKSSTRQLISFLSIVNSDEEISQLADSIILKKNIELNMNQVYDLLYN